MINCFLIKACTSQGTRACSNNSIVHSHQRYYCTIQEDVTWFGNLFANLNRKCVVFQHRCFQHKFQVYLSTKTCDIYNLKAWFISLVYRHITKAYWIKVSSRKSSLLQWMQDNTPAALALWLLSTGRVANCGVQPHH